MSAKTAPAHTDNHMSVEHLSETVEMDREIADRMQNENFEQFQTLVRMHLSFELDLNTEAVEPGTPRTFLCYSSNEGSSSGKQRSRKLFAFPKKSKQVQGALVKSPPFNVLNTLTTVGIQQIKQMISFLAEEQNIVQEGIFRKAGSVSRQNELRRRLDEQTVVDFSAYTVHDCASVLKSIIADLPEPLLTDNFYAVHCQIAELYNSKPSDGGSQTKETRLLQSIQLLLLLLPSENRTMFHDINNMLNETSKHESSNKMSAESLATLFTPHLICPRKLSPEALHTTSQSMSGLISFMIGRGQQLQNIPPKLATDIRAYLVEQKRKKVMSPELQMLDESVTSDSTANTVYTFVDREKTAEAHTSNPTDTGLAELYAHIQSLPESSKKQKLVKLFNKQNGNGTPLQQQMMMRMKKSNAPSPRPNKSLSGSIKKHIFKSALGSKTPKRGVAQASTPSSATVTTPAVRRDMESLKSGDATFQTPIANRLKAPTDDNAKATTSLQPPTTNGGQSGKTTDQGASLNGDIENVPQTEQSGDMQRSDGSAGKRNDDNYHTPASLKLDKFMMCFKSEPDLSRAQSASGDDKSRLNRGRFIARKLLSGVSMINLRQPLAAANDPPAALNVPPVDGVLKVDAQSLMSVELGSCPSGLESSYVAGTKAAGDVDVQGIEQLEQTNDEDDEDFVDDEEVDREYNESIDDEGIDTVAELKQATHADQVAKLRSVPATSGGNSTLSDSIANDAVSPITKSTHRMSKAMQESIMTPRSRKPVIFGALRDIAADNYHKNFVDFELADNQNSDDYRCNMDADPLNASLQRSKSESSLLLKTPGTPDAPAATGEESAMARISAKSTSDETLSTPFRQYLWSRSLLMATPVDTSFSSQSDDFENLDDSQMSESLIYCLNGNEPIEYVGVPAPSTPRNGTATKRPLNSAENCSAETAAGTGDNPFADFNCISAKKNHLELDETAL